MAQSMELVLNQREGGTELAESGGKESFDLIQLFVSQLR